MIKLKNVEKKFQGSTKNVYALKDVTLEIGEGETVALCGPSGAGKSTLLHVIGLMDEPTAGSVSVFGRDASSLGSKEKSALRSRSIGFLFQFHYLMNDFTVMENLMIPVMIDDPSLADKRKKRLREMLSAFGVGEMEERYPFELSGGEQQRVALARALANEPRLILADEPTGNLDSANSREMMGLLFGEVEKTNATLVIATHDMELAGKTKRILNIKDGIIQISTETRK